MVSIPRSALSYSKSGKVDQPGNYKSAMYRLAGDLRDQAIAELKLNAEYAEIPNYIAALRGEQWGKGRPKYRSNFVDNVLAKARVEAKAYLTDIQPTVDIRSKVDTYTKQATLIQNCLHHEWRRMNMDLRLAALVDHAGFGIAYARLGGLFPGELVFRSFGMDTVLPIQRGDTIQESSAVLYRTHKPIQYFTKMFPGRSEGIAKYADQSMTAMTTNQYARPGHVDEYTWNSMSPAMKYKMGIKMGRPTASESEPFPTISLEEFWVNDPAVNETKERILIRNPYLSVDEHNYWYWVEPGQPLWPRKRLIIFGGEKQLLYDGPSPYWHGEYPFGELILDPVVWGPGGFSRYRALMPLNRGINEMNAGIFDMVKKSLNQSLIGKKGAIADTVFERFFQDMPGSKMLMNPGANPASDLQWGPIPQLPAYTPQFLQHLYQRFDRQAGGMDAMTLAKKKQLPSSDVIQQMKDSQSGQFRLEGRYLEAFLGDIGPQAVSNIIQFFTRDKRISLFGADGITKQDFNFRPGDITPWQQPRESHWLNFDVEITPGSLHGGSRDGDINKYIGLYRLHAISLRELHRKLEIGNSESIIKEIAEEAKAGITPGGGNPRQQRSAGQKKGQPV
jgi:hypothetical protein